MTDSDGNDVHWAESIDEIDEADPLDTFLDHLLSGADPAADAPAWSHDVALLVRAAQAPARPDELVGEQDIVNRMVEARRSATEAGALATVTRLTDRRGVDRGDRHYRAKHAAARLEASHHPAIRTVGRVLAMKAVAVTTVAVVGVAAAAATTGIVATVVVPAFSNAPSEPTPVPTTESHRRTETTGGARDPEPADPQHPAVCPIVPTCAAPPFTAASPTTTVATAGSTTTTEAVRADGTTPSTSSTVPTTTTSTTISTQTTDEPTTTSTSAPDPDPGPSTLATDDGAGGTAGTGGGTP